MSTEFYIDQCTCAMTHSFVYQGCKKHEIESKSLSTKEIMEIKQELHELRQAFVDLKQLLETQFEEWE